MAEPLLTRARVLTAIGLVLGTVALGVSLHIEPGSGWFYPSTVLLALVWILAALASGELRLAPAGAHPMRQLGLGAGAGVGLGALFVIGALVVRLIPGLDDWVASVLDYADRGSLVAVTVVTLLSGIAEELFFRGAVFGVLPRHPIVLSTVVYAVSTAATGNVMLVVAAVVLGLVAATERRLTGGILAPAATHAVWAMVMLYALPPLFP